MRRCLSASLLTLLGLLTVLQGRPAAARSQVIKVGTMAPRGTLPHRALMQMADLIAAETDGQTVVKIYPGVVGDEPTIVRKLRIGQLQGALLSAKGLGLLAREPIAVQLPMMFADEGEIDALLEQMRPRFDAALKQAGVVTLAWSDGGWIYLFSDRPATAVDDLARRKMWLWQHDKGAVECFASLGLEPVVLSEVDMVPALRTGMIDTVPATPMAALALQLYPTAPHMVDVPIAFMLAAVVLSNEAWEKIPADARQRILARSQQAGQQMSAQARRDNLTAMAELRQRGVVVHRPDAAQQKVWTQRGHQALLKARGVSVEAELVDEVLKRRDAYRASQTR